MCQEKGRKLEIAWIIQKSFADISSIYHSVDLTNRGEISCRAIWGSLCTGVSQIPTSWVKLQHEWTGVETKYSHIWTWHSSWTMAKRKVAPKARKNLEWCIKEGIALKADNNRKKKFGPPSLTLKKFWSLAYWKKMAPPVTTPKDSGHPTNRRPLPPSWTLKIVSQIYGMFLNMVNWDFTLRF